MHADTRHWKYIVDGIHRFTKYKFNKGGEQETIAEVERGI
jgi:hypothetical protein